jgi:prepilin-type N-terminal cleavage/methylation domain-containing protein
MKLSSRTRGFTLVELMITVVLIGVVGLVLYSILYTTTVLGAKNTAVNVAHQQARVAMVGMLQDLHSSVSLPALANPSGTPYASPAPANAEGIAFQQWSSGPHKIKNDVAVGATQIQITLTANAGPAPVALQRLIIPAYQIEADITAVDNSSPGNPKISFNNISGPGLVPPVTYPTSTLPVAIKGTGSTAGDIVCFVTDRCSYTVSNTTLKWNWKGNNRTVGNYITNATPFSTPTTPAGALYYRFVAAIDLSTSDLQYSNRGYKSANILLNGQVPFKTRLTTYQ